MFSILFVILQVTGYAYVTVVMFRYHTNHYDELLMMICCHGYLPSLSRDSKSRESVNCGSRLNRSSSLMYRACVDIKHNASIAMVAMTTSCILKYFLFGTFSEIQEIFKN